MRQITDIYELRQLQINILNCVDEFCQANKLRYFLSSGTLIGAVRHKGYIPWDDDIDIYMPRRDYELFIQSFHDNSGRYRIINPQRERHYYYTFAKVVDQKTRLIEPENKGYEIGVYIDVFPVDYVTDNMKERKRVFRLKHLLYKIRRCKISHSNPLYSYTAYLCYRFLPVSVGWIEKKLRNLIILTHATSTVCNMTEAGPGMSGCFPAEDIESTVEIEFEGRRYTTMVGYKDYLQRTYGDYMTLPPVERRVTHKFEAYLL